MKITNHRAGHTTVMAVAADVTPVPSEAVKAAPEWDKWQTPVPSLPVLKTMIEEEVLANEILSLLQSDVLDDSLRQKLDRYLRLSAYDLSLETRQQRGQIARLLRSKPNAKEWKEELERLFSQCGTMGTQTFGGDVYLKWMSILTCADFAQAFADGTMPQKAEVDEALYNFPMKLWDVWEYHREYFVARLYYACIPRKVLWRFVSTLAFHELLSSTPAGSMVAVAWASQAMSMPDKTLLGFYSLLTFLRDNGANISNIATRLLMKEIKRRGNLAIEEKSQPKSDISISVSGDAKQLNLGKGEYNQ